jgi:DNA-binding PadR family transcriptional regulator
MTSSDVSSFLPLSPTDFHVMLVLGSGPLYGYAILKALEEESGGAVTPEIGSLYRVIARLVTQGLVVEADAPEPPLEPHPGRERRYYRLTALGQTVMRAEAARLQDALGLARHRDLLPETGRS